MSNRVEAKKIENLLNKISVFLLCLLIIVFDTPILYRYSATLVNYGSLALMGAYLFLNLNYFINLRGYSHNTLVLLAVFFFVQAFYKVVGISSAPLYYYYISVKFFFFFLVLLGPFQSLNTKQMKWILNTIIVSVFLNLADNVLLYMRFGADKYILLSRNDYLITNVVDTQYVASLLILSGTLFIYFVYGNKNRIPALILSIVATLFSVLIAQRGIMLVLFLIMFFLFFMLNLKLKSKTFLWVMFSLIISVFIILNITTILSWLTQVIPSARIISRINQILSLLSTQGLDSTGSLSGRYRLINVSISSFSSSVFSFLFGVGDHRIDNFIIGNHSFVFDELARYGLLGASLSFWLLLRCFNILRRKTCIQTGTSISKCLNIILFLVVLRGFLGGIIDAVIGLQLFVMLPLIFKFINLQNSKFV